MHLIRHYPRLIAIVALSVLTLLNLPRFVWLSLLIVSPPLIAFIATAYSPHIFWNEDRDAPQWYMLIQSAGIACALLLGVHLLLLVFGNRVFSGHGIMIVLFNLLIFGAVPVISGIAVGLVLNPAWATINIGMIGILAGIGVVVLDALLPFNMLWILLFPPLISTVIATWQNKSPRDDLVLRAGLIAGILAGGIPALTIAITTRAVLCLGADACTGRFDPGAAIILYGAMALCLAMSLLLIAPVGLVTMFLRRQH